MNAIQLAIQTIVNGIIKTRAIPMGDATQVQLQVTVTYGSLLVDLQWSADLQAWTTVGQWTLTGTSMPGAVGNLMGGYIRLSVSEEFSATGLFAATAHLYGAELSGSPLTPVPPMA